MPMDVAQLSVRINADTKGAEEGIGRVGERVHSASGWKSILSNAISFGGAMVAVNAVAGGMSFLTGQITDMVKAGMDGNRMSAILAQGLKSTHDASGMTAQSLDDLSNKIMNMTGIDDDAVKSAEQMLLTFTGIGKTVFPQAAQAAADMATRMNGGAIPSAQQMQQQALLLGKALNDPLKGITALTREGVTFSDQQKQQIATMMAAGNTAGAQAIMIAELNKEFGGSAKAAGEANGGIAILSAQFDNMKQTIGQALVPVFVQLMSALKPITESMANALPGAIAIVTPLFQQVGTMLNLIGQVVSHNLQPALTAIKGAFGDMGKSVKGVDLTGIINTVTQLAGEISDSLNTAIVNLMPVIKALGQWFMKEGLPALQQFGAFIFNNVIPVIAKMQQQWYGSLLPVLRTVFQVFVSDILPALQRVWVAISENLIPSIQRLWEKLSPVLIPALQLVGWTLQNVVGPALGFALTLVGKLIDIIATLIGKIGDLLGWLGRVKDAIGNAFSGLGNINFPHFAEGGVMSFPGMAMVGENGPEMVALPAGARVFNASQTANLMRPAASASGSGGSGGSAGGYQGPQVVQIHIAGHRVAEALLPDLVDTIRRGTGVKF